MTVVRKDRDGAEFVANMRSKIGKQAHAALHYASLGLNATIVQSPDYRGRKVATALELLPRMLGPDAAPATCSSPGPTGPSNRPHTSS